MARNGKKQKVENIMPGETRFDFVILGSGSMVFAAALRARELGKTSVRYSLLFPGGLSLP
jgi:hypothetical protein